MAYDKAVDSAALDAGLTAIANAIREKAGSSDVLAFPDAMAAAIAAIEAGGGGGSAFATGTYTAVENVGATNVEITHGLGVIPKTIMWFVTAPTGKVYAERPLLALFCDEYGCSTCGNASSGSTATMNYQVGTYKIEKLNPTEETIKLSDSMYISGGSIMAGFTVTWAVWG